MAVTVKSSPAQKAFKNRKKTLRQREQAGLITEAQRVELQRDAYWAMKRGEWSAAATAQRATVERAEKFLSSGGVYPHGECDPLCLAAVWSHCDCRCGGVNHGAATPASDRNFLTVQERAARDAERAAKREAVRAERARKKAERAERARRRAAPLDADGVHPFAPHGTENGYCHWGCRCDPCRAGNRQTQRTRRNRRKNS